MFRVDCCSWSRSSCRSPFAVLLLQSLEDVRHPLHRIQRSPQIVRHRIREGLQLPIGRPQRRCPLLHPRLQLIACPAQSRVPLLNLHQHLVERLDQHSNLVIIRVRRRAHRIVPLPRNLPRRFGQRRDRPRHHLPHPRSDQNARRHADEQHAQRDHQILPRTPARLPQLCRNEDRPLRLSLENDPVRQQDMASLHPVLIGPSRRHRRQRRLRPRSSLPLAPVIRKHLPVAGHQRRAHHVRRVAQRLQRRRRALRVVKQQRRHAVRPYDLRRRRQIPDQILPERNQVIAEERDYRQHQHCAAHQHVHPRQAGGNRPRSGRHQLVRQRGVHGSPPVPGLPVTLTATFSSSELSPSPLWPAAPRFTEKRT